jgi:DNA polymerase elongation subunit (family B)
MIYVYDIECLKNFFCVTFRNVETKNDIPFVIFEDRNDIDQLYKFISRNKSTWFVGYNSYSYDDQLLTYLYNIYNSVCFCTSQEICQLMFDKSIDIINGKATRLVHIPFRHIDLMKVGNIRKSLKLVAVNLNWNKIQDLPIDPQQYVTKEQVDMILSYNLNDVRITEELYYRLKDKLSLRWDITNKYKINVISESDSGMANRLLEKLYSEKTGITISELRQLRTPRQIIHFENVIFEDIKFETKELQNMLENLYSHKWFKNMPFFKKRIMFNGAAYQMGVGGLHSEDEPGKFESNESVDIIDSDVTSMYAFNMINHNLKPGHLTFDFLNIYKQLVKDRVDAKNRGDKSVAETLKITILSVWGKTLNENHWLYDPLVGLRLTINGQLYLMMLIEKLSLYGFKVISANTDGIVTIVPKDKNALYKICCDEWCKQTNFNLEFTEYKKYIRRDVNNYITLKKDNTTKEKGIFVIEPNLQQGIDKPIISKALYRYFINDVPVRDTIMNSRDILEFCVSKRSDEKFINEYHWVTDEGEKKVDALQKTLRFYCCSRRGGYLYKKDPKDNKLIIYCRNSPVAILNDWLDKDVIDKYVNYEYYIKECNKIINEIETKQLTLF